MKLTEQQLKAVKADAEKPMAVWTQVQYSSEHGGWCVMRGAHNTGLAYRLAGPYETKQRADMAMESDQMTPNALNEGPPLAAVPLD